ncbi:putative ribonuclease H-like domain-containing protein, partial [Tanacetum coccineum]
LSKGANSLQAEEQVSEDRSSFVESSLNVDKETVFLVDKKIEFSKSKNHEKPVKKSVRSFDHIQAHCKYHQRERMVDGNNYNRVNYNYTTNRTHPNAQRNMVPRAVLMKTGLKPFNTARKVNTAHPKFTAKAVNTARPKAVNTARPHSTVVNDVRVNQENAGKPQQDDTGFIDSGCLRYMTGNIGYLSDFKEFDRGYVTFGGGAHGVRISGKGTLKIDSLDFKDILLKIPKESLTCLVAKATLDESMLWNKRLGHINFKNINKLVKDNLVRGLPTKRFENDQTCVACLKRKQHRASSRTPQQNGVAERRNRTLIEAARTMLADSKLHTTFWTKAVSIACYVQNKVLVVKPHNKTPYELFRGFKPALSFMRPFGCHVIILNTLENLGKFDGKSDEGLFVGYSLSSKAFKVYNKRTRRVEENLHTGFLENKSMIEGNGPKWLFNIDSLTQSMNYVPVAAGIITNESAGTQGELNAGTSTCKEEISKDCIVMPIWKDASYFDSPSKDVGNGEPKFAADDQKQVEDGPHNESDEKDKSEDDNSPKEVNTAGQHVNTASPEVNTNRFKLNTVDPSANTTSSYDLDSPKDMFKLGASHTLEATHVEFFSDEDEPEVDL